MKAIEAFAQALKDLDVACDLADVSDNDQRDIVLSLDFLTPFKRKELAELLLQNTAWTIAKRKWGG